MLQKMMQGSLPDNQEKFMFHIRRKSGNFIIQTRWTPCIFSFEKFFLLQNSNFFFKTPYYFYQKIPFFLKSQFFFKKFIFFKTSEVSFKKYSNFSLKNFSLKKIITVKGGYLRHIFYSRYHKM